MKLALIYLQLMTTINMLNHQDYIGKSIEIYEDRELINRFHDFKVYKIINVNKTLYENKIDFIYATANNENIITKITFYFPYILGIPFYNNLIKEYGSPFSVKKFADNSKNISYESNEIGYGISLKTNVEDTSLDKTPWFIIWEIDNHSHISVTNNYINKITKVEYY